MEFEWDADKAVNNEYKHQVSFLEAATIFSDPLELTIADPDHSVGEYRFISIGQASTGKVLVVAYTERETNRIRIISARPATKHEIRDYERSH